MIRAEQHVHCSDVFVARSSNGNRFDNLRISSVASNDSLTNPSRDTQGTWESRTAIAISQGGMVIAWTDTRQGSEDIFLSIVEVTRRNKVAFTPAEYREETPYP